MSATSHPSQNPTAAPQDLYITVIDWGFDSSVEPTVLIGPNRDDLNALAVKLIQTGDLNSDEEVLDFLNSHPLQINDIPAVQQWLADMRDALTAPWIDTYLVHPNGFTTAQESTCLT